LNDLPEGIKSKYGQIIATSYKTVDYIDFGKRFSIGGNRSELPSLQMVKIGAFWYQ